MASAADASESPGFYLSEELNPKVVEAKALLDTLPHAARLALGSRLANGYGWRAFLTPKMNQLISGAKLPAPAVDPDRCRKTTSILPTTSDTITTDSSTRIVESDSTSTEEATRMMETADTSYWDLFRSEVYETTPETVITEPVFTRDLSAWDSFRVEALDTLQPEPEISDYDLCMQRTEMEANEQKLNADMNQITVLLVDIIKEPLIDNLSRINAAETYLTALTTLYLQGRLLVSADAGPNCVDLNLLDFNLLSPQKYPAYWSSNSGTFTKDYGLRPLVMQMACLPDAEALRLASAFSNALHIVGGVVASTQSKKAGEIRKAIMSDYLPFIVALFDRTKAAGPGPLYKLLLDYRKAQGIAEDYGVPYLLLWNPSIQTHVEAPVCDGYVFSQANDYYADKFGSGPGPTPTMQIFMQGWLDIYNDQFKKGKGPKTLYGAAITYVSVQSETLAAHPVWITKDAMPSSIQPSCLYLPNFMHMLLHPMPLGDASCPAWNTSRLGKICPYKPKPATVSAAKKIKWIGWLAFLRSCKIG